VMFVVVELGYYWSHRMGHEWNLIWAGHNVHHSSDEYNLFTAFRQSPVFAAFAPVFYLPIALFMPLRLFAAHRGINTIYQFWIHTQFIGKLPSPIEFIFNTPSHHRVHHGRNSQYIDKNYGGTLIIFDRMFGTFEPEQEAVVYGITHMPATWNPFVVQLHHYYECWEVAKRTPGVLNKIRVFFDLGPAYNWRVLHYDEVIKHPVPAEPVTVDSADSRKLRLTMPNRPMRIYGYVHFVVELLQVGIFAVAHKHMEAADRYSVVAHILISMYALALCIEGIWYAPYVEALRGILTLGVFYHYLPRLKLLANVQAPALAVAAAFTLASIVWVLLYQRPRSVKAKDVKASGSSVGEKEKLKAH